MMAIILLSLLCAVTILYLQHLLLHGIVERSYPEKPTASLLPTPGTIGPHTVIFNYVFKSSAISAINGNIGNVCRVQCVKAVNR
jgi:hypothetical protein